MLLLNIIAFLFLLQHFEFYNLFLQPHLVLGLISQIIKVCRSPFVMLLNSRYIFVNANGASIKVSFIGIIVKIRLLKYLSHILALCILRKSY